MLFDAVWVTHLKWSTEFSRNPKHLLFHFLWLHNVWRYLISKVIIIFQGIIFHIFWTRPFQKSIGISCWISAKLVNGTIKQTKSLRFLFHENTQAIFFISILYCIAYCTDFVCEIEIKGRCPFQIEIFVIWFHSTGLEMNLTKLFYVGELKHKLAGNGKCL